MKKDVQIVIVAAGVGSRMRPLTETTPKFLIPIKGKPLIQYQLEEFKKQGFTHILFCLGFLANKVVDYFKKERIPDLLLTYSLEPYTSPERLSGTAGAVKYAQSKIKSKEFIVYYGDNLTNLNFHDLISFHRKKNAFATIVMRPQKKNGDIKDPTFMDSAIILDDNQRVNLFLEKPDSKTKKRYLTQKRYENNGIYVCDQRIFAYLPEGKFVDFAKDVFPRLIKEGKPVYGYASDKFFREMGRMEKYI